VNEIEAPRVEEFRLEDREPLANAYITVDLDSGDDTLGTFSFNKEFEFNRPFKTTAAAQACAENLKLLIGEYVSIHFYFVVIGKTFSEIR
jgi:hypothetical protein